MQKIFENWREYKRQVLSEAQETTTAPRPPRVRGYTNPLPRQPRPSSGRPRLTTVPRTPPPAAPALSTAQLKHAADISRADAWRQAQIARYGENLIGAPKSVLKDPRWYAMGELPHTADVPWAGELSDIKPRPGVPQKPAPAAPRGPLSNRSPSGRVVQYPAPVIDPLTGKAVPPPGFKEPYPVVTKATGKTAAKTATKLGRQLAGGAAAAGLGLGLDFLAAYGDNPEAAEAERLGVSPHGSTDVADWMRKEEEFIASIVPGASTPSQFKYRPLSKDDIDRINSVEGIVGLSNTPTGKRTTKEEVRNLVYSYLSKGISLEPWMKRVTKRLPSGQYSVEPRVHGYRERARLRENKKPIHKINILIG